MVQVIYSGSSRYGRYQIVDRVYNDRPARLLLSGDHSAPQSGMALDGQFELLFDYNQRLFEVALSLHPQSVLAIGGGAFTLPRAILRQLPDTVVDVVEIDRLLLRLARKYFQLGRDRRLKIFTTDGRSYIDNCRRRYDLIIVDAFSDYDIPRSLLTVEAARRYARLLEPAGSLAINIIDRYRGSLPTLVHRMQASFRHGFTSTSVYPADIHDDQNSPQNLIFIASHLRSPSLDYLMSAQVHPERFDLDPLELHDEAPPS